MLRTRANFEPEARQAAACIKNSKRWPKEGSRDGVQGAQEPGEGSMALRILGIHLYKGSI
jgi:hypothetical protein